MEDENREFAQKGNKGYAKPWEADKRSASRLPYSTTFDPSANSCRRRMLLGEPTGRFEQTAAKRVSI